MTGVISIVVLLALVAIAVALWTIFRQTQDQLTSHRIWAIVAVLFAIWALITSWIWVYYFNLILSAPAFLIAALINVFLYRKGKELALARLVNVVLVAALFISLLSLWMIR